MEPSLRPLRPPTTTVSVPRDLRPDLEPQVLLVDILPGAAAMVAAAAAVAVVMATRMNVEALLKGTSVLRSSLCSSRVLLLLHTC